MSREFSRQDFYGTVLIALGVWETAAYGGIAPTITATVHRHKVLRPVWCLFLVGAGRHLWG